MSRRRWRLLVAVAMLGAASKVCFGFVGVPFLFAPPVLTTATGVALSSWAAIAAGVGALLYSVGLQDNNGNEFMGVRVNPNAPQKVPSGWTASSTAGADPVPPSSAGAPQVISVTSFDHTDNGTWASGQASCQQMDGELTEKNLTVGGCTSPITFSTFAANNGTCNVHRNCSGTTLADISYSYTVGCPTGYTNNLGICTLSSPSSVPFPADNRCGLTISGGVMSYDSRDPDCTGTPPAGIVKSSDGKTVTATNAGQQIKIQINADNSVTISSWTPSAYNPGQTVVNTTTIAAPGSAGSTQITSANQGTVNGTGSSAFSVSPTTTQQSFPDDYSREATQQSVLSKLGDVKTSIDNLSKSSDAPTDPVPRTSDDITGVFFPDTFTSLRSWQMPARAVSCPTWSFSVFSQSYAIDGQCTLIEQQRSFFSSIMLLIWSLAALFIVLGA